VSPFYEGMAQQLADIISATTFLRSHIAFPSGSIHQFLTNNPKRFGLSVMANQAITGWVAPDALIGSGSGFIIPLTVPLLWTASQHGSIVTVAWYCFATSATPAFDVIEYLLN
jgi:hypothetical protein